MTLADLLRMYTSGGAVGAPGAMGGMFGQPRGVRVTGQSPAPLNPFMPPPGSRVRVVGQNAASMDEGARMLRSMQANAAMGPRPQFGPIQRHDFPIGDWSGMQGAMARQFSPAPRRSLMPVGGMNTLGSLLGYGGEGY